nr:MAG TPA_asm: hypothetical protein [Caudoviricetes sp.]
MCKPMTTVLTKNALTKMLRVLRLVVCQTNRMS